MGIFKIRTNKKYNYTPRYYKGEGNPFEIKHKFDDYRKTVDDVNLKGKFKNAWDDFKTPDKSVTYRVVIIASIFLLIFLIIIGFDLSIFVPKG